MPLFCRSKKQLRSASLECKIESPPVIFHGDAQSSSGALVSGQLLVHVEDESVEVGSFCATLHIHVHQKKPFADHCVDCREQYTELKRWMFLAHPTTLSHGCHYFPFSVLLEGHLPTSLNTPLVNVSYEFTAELQPAIPKLGPDTPISPIQLHHIFDVKRSITPSEVPKHSARLFPPANIKSDTRHNTVIYATGASNAVQIRLSGLARVESQNQTVEFWKLCKLSWRLEETFKTTAPACKKHSATSPTKPDNFPGVSPTKGTPRVGTRRLAEKHIHDGWKSDYSPADAYAEVEFDYAIAASVLSAHHGTSSGGQQGVRSGYACNTRSDYGVEVSHALIIEMICSREFALLGKPHQTTRRDGVQLIRISCDVVLTDCPGPGVSWDIELPPIYQDVAPSPPDYPIIASE